MKNVNTATQHRPRASQIFLLAAFLACITFAQTQKPAEAQSYGSAYGLVRVVPMLLSRMRPRGNGQNQRNNNNNQNNNQNGQNLDQNGQPIGQGYGGPNAQGGYNNNFQGQQGGNGYGQQAYGNVQGFPSGFQPGHGNNTQGQGFGAPGGQTGFNNAGAAAQPVYGAGQNQFSGVPNGVPGYGGAQPQGGQPGYAAPQGPSAGSPF